MANRNQEPDPRIWIFAVMTILYVGTTALPVCYPRPGGHNPFRYSLDYYIWLWQQPGGSDKVITMLVICTLLISAVIAYDVFRIRE